jgi:type IV pilus assembly protein PilX
MRSHINAKVPRKQRGAVLVVSLLLLLVMTLLALGASQSTRLQERMAGNTRDSEVALQGAEASLRGAEELLSPTHTLATCVAPSSTCEAYEMGTLVDGNGMPLDLARQSDAWWTTWSRQYADNIGAMVRQPQYVIERMAESREVLSTGGSYLNVVRDFHQSTARAAGVTRSSGSVVQTTYSRITFE